MINLDSGDKVTDVARVIKSEEEEKAEVGVVAEE